MNARLLSRMPAFTSACVVASDGLSMPFAPLLVGHELAAAGCVPSAPRCPLFGLVCLACAARAVSLV